MGHRGMASEPARANAGPQSLMAALSKMDKDMAAAPMTGDVDHDFAAMMIPHHQGAVDIAEVELAGGKDPLLRKLAEDIVAAQQREIALLRGWQARRPANR